MLTRALRTCYYIPLTRLCQYWIWEQVIVACISLELSPGTMRRSVMTNQCRTKFKRGLFSDGRRSNGACVTNTYALDIGSCS